MKYREGRLVQEVGNPELVVLSAQDLSREAAQLCLSWGAFVAGRMFLIFESSVDCGECRGVKKD